MFFVKRSVSSVFYFCDAHTVEITFEEFYLALKENEEEFSILLLICKALR